MIRDVYPRTGFFFIPDPGVKKHWGQYLNPQHRCENLTKFSQFFKYNFTRSIPPPRATRRAPFSVQERSGCQLARHSEQNSFLHVGQHTATPCVIEDTASGVDRHPNFYANANPKSVPGLHQNNTVLPNTVWKI
jgi:hypothetical protein